MSCCAPSRRIDGRAPSSGSAAWRIDADVDFRDAATAAIVNGQQTVGGYSWTGQNAATATTFRFLSGTGIDYVSNASNTAWNAAPAFTACALWISLNDTSLAADRRLLPNFDPARTYLFQIWNRDNNGNAATEVVYFNLFQVAGSPFAVAVDRVVGACRGGNATVAGGVGANQGTSVPQLIGSYSARDVLALVPSPGSQGVAMYCGTYDVANDAWPANSDLADCGSYQGSGLAATTSGNAHLWDPSMRLCIAFATGNTTATFAATVQRLRVLSR